jgi:hypothetical protein
MAMRVKGIKKLKWQKMAKTQAFFYLNWRRDRETHQALFLTVFCL